MSQYEPESQLISLPEDAPAEAPNPWLAALLTVFAPGLGFAYCGQIDKAFFINIGYVLACLAFLVSWALLKFFPPLPFLFFLLVYVISLLRHAYYAYQCARHTTAPRTNPIILLSSAVFSFILPLALLFTLSQQLVLQTLLATSDVMLPNMRRGDVIFVDKSAFLFEEPQHGDLVMVSERREKSRARRVFFARIIALPQDTIQMQGWLPFVNRQQLPQWHYRPGLSHESTQRAVELPHTSAQTPDAPPTIEPKSWYSILAPKQILFSKTEIFTLEPDTYFVLEDNRSENTKKWAEQQYGAIVHRSWIKGRPLYVFYNSLDSDPWQNAGLKLR